jgi:hypothetical protein
VNLFLMIFMYCCPYCVVYVPDLLSFFSFGSDFGCRGLVGQVPSVMLSD